MTSKVRRFWETVRWLRFAQISGRIRAKLIAPAVSDSVDVSLRLGDADWQPPASRRPSFSWDGVPKFLNEQGILRAAEDWDRPEVPRLWRYNLHYFADLNSDGAVSRESLHRDLIQRWITENPPFQGTGWEPYPCSLRIVNWIKWSLAGNKLEFPWRESLALQAVWLTRMIEWHLLGNHLFANAKALVFVGLFFKGKAADRWLEKGLEILAREIPEQILKDGGQFELSPMYHSIATEDMLDLINAAQTWPGMITAETVERWREVVCHMLEWAAVMRHPDGKIALLNDSAFNTAPALDEIFDYAERLGIEFGRSGGSLRHLENSGYARAVVEDATLFADVGKIGPDYLPGHAHADTLGFEMSLFGERWFVDTGCSTYEVTDERLRQRGTAAHNTVIVDGKDSSEVWSSFRVARRARPHDVHIHESDDTIVISASHDGYRRLKGRVTHHRKFELKSGQLEITDSLTGTVKSAVANFLLHPEVGVTVDHDVISLRRKNHIATLTFEGGKASIQDATWHPEFGLSLATKRISVNLQSSKLVSRLCWGESG